MKNSTFYTLIALFVGVAVLLSSSGIGENPETPSDTAVPVAGTTAVETSTADEGVVIELPDQPFDLAIEVPDQEAFESAQAVLVFEEGSQYQIPAYELFPNQNFDPNCYPILPDGFLLHLPMTEIADAPVEIFWGTPGGVLTEVPVEAILEEASDWTFEAPAETSIEESSELVFDLPAETSIEESSELVFDPPAETLIAESSELVFDLPAETSIEESSELVFDLPAETPIEESSDLVFDLPAETLIEESSELVFDLPVEILVEDGTGIAFETPLDDPLLVATSPPLVITDADPSLVNAGEAEGQEGFDSSNVAFAEAPTVVFPLTLGGEGGATDLPILWQPPIPSSSAVVGDSEIPAVTVIGPIVTGEGADSTDPAGDDPVTGGVADDEERQAQDLREVERRIGELRRFVREDIQRQRWSRVLGRLKELVALRPYNADYHLTLGLVYRRLAAEALEDLGSELKSEGKTDAVILAAQRDLARNLLEFTGAQRKFQEYEDFGGNEAISSLLLADVLAVRGVREEVFTLLDRAASLGINIARASRQFPSLESYTHDTRFVRAALKLEHYEIQHEGLRDPFTSSFNRLSRPGTPGDPVPGGWNVERQQKVLGEARQAVKRIEYALRINDEEKAKEFYVQLRSLGGHLSRFTEPELAAEFRAILDRIDEIEKGIDEIRLSYLYGLAYKGTQEMERAFLEQDFQRLDEVHGEVERLALDLEVVDNDYILVAQKIREFSDRLLERSEIVREFRARNIRIQGIIVSTDGSQAIIENRWLEEGFSFDGVKVAKIEPTRVIFLYRGELIPQMFRRY